MQLLRSLAVLSLLLFGVSATTFSQSLPTGTGPGTSVTLGGGYSIYHIPYGERDLGGYQGWVDAGLYWRASVEAEARQLRQNQDLGTHASTYLIGPRYSFRPSGFEPYVKVLAGMGRFTFPYNYARGNYFVVAGGGGVDLHVGDRIRFRVLDLEYQEWPQFTFGSMNSFGISSGVSIVLYRGATRMSD